jgi:hypothetical protein
LGDLNNQIWRFVFFQFHSDDQLENSQTTAAFAALLVPTPIVLLYLDSVMIKYMKELDYGVFNNQSCAKSDFLLSIGAAQMKRGPIPFMVHKYFLSAIFLVLIISHINMMLIVMFEHHRRLHNGDYSQNKKLSKCCHCIISRLCTS